MRALVLDDETAFQRLAAPLDPHTVIVSHGAPLQGGCASPPVVTTDLSPEHVEQRLEACGEGYAVLADAWFPGWTVEVDGVRAQPVRAFGFLRAVRVAAGRHVVHWRYTPTSFHLGTLISGLAFAAALVAWRRKVGRGQG